LTAVERRRRRLAVAVPSSLVSDTPHLREKTARVGLLARAAAIFRVDEVAIYLESPKANRREAEFLERILLYMDTPQYLRRRIFPVSPEMRYVGVLPPLRTPHHPLQMKKVEPVSYREGLVLSLDRNRAIVDVGRPKPVKIRGVGLLPGSRVTVKIERSQKGEEFSAIPRDSVPSYWGYDVSFSGSLLGETLKPRKNEMIIMTSKYGRPISKELVSLKRELREASRLMIIFGSPQEGIKEILAREGLKPEALSKFVLNTVPLQGTETVRTEEAVYATLALLNIIESEEDEASKAAPGKEM